MEFVNLLLIQSVAQKSLYNLADPNGYVPVDEVFYLEDLHLDLVCVVALFSNLSLYFPDQFLHFLAICFLFPQLAEIILQLIHIRL